MKTLLITLTRCLSLLSLVLSAQVVSAFYDPAVQRWVNRDPLPDEGFQNLLLDDVGQSVRLENGFAFVSNHPLGQVDPLGLIVYQGCLKKQKDIIEKTLKNKCKAAQACASKCPNPAASSTIGKLCNGGKEVTINCVGADFTFRDGTSCKTKCGQGTTSGPAEIFLCPSALNDPGACGGPECTLFHEDLHTGGFPHGDDMTKFDQCMGCKPTLPKPAQKPK